MANERRLIDANALLSELVERQYSEQTMGIMHSQYPHFQAIVERQPTVDAVEVVRCEECKYRDDCVKRIEFMGRNLALELNTHEYHPLKFCSYGERKEG